MYSHSEEEENRLKRMIHEKQYYIFHENFLDENGNSTDGTTKQIIFGSDELKKKSIHDRWIRSSANFIGSIEPVKRLLELYPVFYNLYERIKINEFMRLLKIDDVAQLDDELKQLLKEATMIYPPETDLDKLATISALKKSEEWSLLVEKTGKNTFSVLPDKLDELMRHHTSDMFYLSRESEFLNEMILVYIITIFKEYLKSNLKEIDTLCPELQINPNSDNYKKIWNSFKNELNFDLEQISEYKSIEEKFLRRNLLIHNNGIPDEKYKMKTNYVGDSRLKTDKEYVKNSIKTFEQSKNIIHAYLWKQYVNPKFLEQMNSEDIIE